MEEMKIKTMEDKFLYALQNVKAGDTFYHCDFKWLGEGAKPIKTYVWKVGREYVYFLDGSQIERHGRTRQLDHRKRVNYRANNDDRLFATEEDCKNAINAERDRRENAEVRNALERRIRNSIFNTSGWSLEKLGRVVAAMEGE